MRLSWWPRKAGGHHDSIRRLRSTAGVTDREVAGRPTAGPLRRTRPARAERPGRFQWQQGLRAAQQDVAALRRHALDAEAKAVGCCDPTATLEPQLSHGPRCLL